MQVKFREVLQDPGSVATSLRQELPKKVKLLLDVFRLIVEQWYTGADADHKEGQWHKNTGSGDVKVPLLGGLGIRPGMPISVILAGESIPACAHPIGPVLLSPVAVTQGEGVTVGGQCAASLASETHSIYEYGLCMHAAFKDFFEHDIS